MAKSKAVEQQLGTDAKIAEASEAASANSSGWHAPRWAYAVLGTLAGAVILYETVAAATALPANPLRIGRNAQPTPVVTPFVQPTPELSQYQKQALEQIALIGQKEPGLADVLAALEWTRNDGSIKSYGLEKLQFIENSVSEGSYTLDSLVSGSATTTIFAHSTDEFRRTTLSQVVKASIPMIADFLGVKYDRPFLLIDFDASTSKAAGGFMWISSDDWTLRNKTHEAGHEVYEGGISTSEWMVEGSAELAGIYAASKLPETLPNLSSLMASPEWKGRDKSIPDFEQAYNVSVTCVNREMPVCAEGAGPMPKGFVFLYEFRQLVGQEAFAEAMGHLYDVRMVRGAGNSTLTDKDIEGILEQHVPQAQLPQFEQLYQMRIYDLPTTN